MLLQTQIMSEEDYHPFIEQCLPHVKLFSYTWFNVQARKRRHLKKHTFKMTPDLLCETKDELENQPFDVKQKWASRLLAKLRKDIKPECREEFIAAVTGKENTDCVISTADPRGKMKRIDCLRQADKVWRLDLVMMILFHATPLESTHGERLGKIASCKHKALCVNPTHICIVAKDLDLFLSNFLVQKGLPGQPKIETPGVFTRKELERYSRESILYRPYPKTLDGSPSSNSPFGSYTGLPSPSRPMPIKPQRTHPYLKYMQQQARLDDKLSFDDGDVKDELCDEQNQGAHSDNDSGVGVDTYEARPKVISPSGIPIQTSYQAYTPNSPNQQNPTYGSPQANEMQLQYMANQWQQSRNYARQYDDSSYQPQYGSPFSSQAIPLSRSQSTAFPPSILPAKQRSYTLPTAFERNLNFYTSSQQLNSSFNNSYNQMTSPVSNGTQQRNIQQIKNENQFSFQYKYNAYLQSQDSRVMDFNSSCGSQISTASMASCQYNPPQIADLSEVSEVSTPTGGNIVRNLSNGGGNNTSQSSMDVHNMNTSHQISDDEVGMYPTLSNLFAAHNQQNSVQENGYPHLINQQQNQQQQSPNMEL